MLCSFLFLDITYVGIRDTMQVHAAISTRFTDTKVSYFLTLLVILTSHSNSIQVMITKTAKKCSHGILVNRNAGQEQVFSTLYRLTLYQILLYQVFG